MSQIRENLYAICSGLIEEWGSSDPFVIAEGLGAVIVYAPLIRVNGFYQRYDNVDIIYINDTLTEEEQMIVCAHELGHMILHKDVNTIFLETTLQVTSRYELEANAFAVQLLEHRLNLLNEIPLIDWSIDNLALMRRVFFTRDFPIDY